MLLGFTIMTLLALLKARQKIGFLFSAASAIIIVLIAWTAVFSQLEQGQSIADKFDKQVRSVIGYGLFDGDTTNRADLWRNSISTFVVYPIFGIGPATQTNNPYFGYQVGGHSSLFDTPAEYGCIGFAFCVAFVGAAFYRAMSAYKYERTRLLSNARLASCFTYLVGGSFNPVLFILPLNVLFIFFVLGNVRPAVLKGREFERS